MDDSGKQGWGYDRQPSRAVALLMALGLMFYCHWIGKPLAVAAVLGMAIVILIPFMAEWKKRNAAAKGSRRTRREHGKH